MGAALLGVAKSAAARYPHGGTSLPIYVSVKSVLSA